MKLYNSDCIEVLKTLPAESINLCVTDPPYRIISGGDSNGRYKKMSGRCSHSSSLTRQGKIFEHNDISFDEWLPLVYRVMKPETHTYIMTNARNLKDLWIAAENAGFAFQQLLVWEKGNVLPNKFYMNAYELILMLRKGGQRWINDMGAKNIIKIPATRNKKHPTEKPVELMKFLIEQSSGEGDTVLDLFMGCGSTGLACNGREFIGIEIDKEYYDIAAGRLGVGDEILDV